MRYGEDKSLEMARSLLPSTRRQAVRKSRTRLHRSVRRTARTRVAQLIRAPELAEDCAELDEDTSSEMRGLVWERQAADKVNPFIRWATQRTLDQPRDMRMGLSTERGLMAQLLRQLLRLPTGQKSFNGYLKRASATRWSRQWGHDGRRHVVLHGGDAPRLLLGAHDVLPFLDDLGIKSHQVSSWSHPRPHAPIRPVALKFLRAFHQLGGDLTATLAALPVPVLTNLSRGDAHGP